MDKDKNIRGKAEMQAVTEIKDGQLIAIGSTEDRDRVGDVLKVEDWDLAKFKKNPVLQAGHDYRPQFTIGIAKNIRVEGKKLIFEPFFHTLTQLATDIKAMYENGFLKAWSVGYIPAEAEGGKNELLEVSAVAVPANANALTVMKDLSGDKEKIIGKKIDEWIRDKGCCGNGGSGHEALPADKDKVEEEKKNDKKKIEADKKDVNIKPYENEHSCRLKSPGDYSTCRRTARDHEGKKYGVITCKRKDDPEKWEEQAYRYDKEVWTEGEAKNHCEGHDGSFEAAAGESKKGTIPYSVHGNGPKAEENAEWDAGTEVKKASGDENRLMKMHAWVDSSAEDFDADERQWYKLPHHKGDGDQPVVWSGVAAAMGALLGARGGVGIPDGDRRAVYGHLKGHYKQFDKEAPEFKEYSMTEFIQLIIEGKVNVSKSYGHGEGVGNKDMKAIERWNLSLSKVFDVEFVKRPASSFEYDLFTKFLGCQVKNIFKNNLMIPSPLLGTYLAAFKYVFGGFKLKDTRNFDWNGYESPPIYEVIKLNSKKSDDFLVEGTNFYVDEGDRPMILKFEPTFWGIVVSIISTLKEKDRNKGLMDKVHQWAKDNNYLKGEKFGLSGEFLPPSEKTWEDVILEEGIKDPIMKAVKFINEKKSDLPSRGMLFMGEPGTGKTQTGKVMMNEADATFIWVSSRDFQKLNTVTILSLAFSLARDLAPTVLFIEDIDYWLKDYTIDLLKTEMDGIRENKGVVTVLTSNFPEKLPKSLIDRPGRFHDVLNFKEPNSKMRREMIKRWAGDIDKALLGDIVERTRGYSGAYIRELVDFANMIAEDDGVDVGKALVMSLEKLEKQRELVGSIMRAGSEASEKAMGAATKEGRVISQKNRTIIQKAIEASNTAVMALEELLKATESPEGGAGKVQAPAKAKGNGREKGREPKEVGGGSPVGTDEIVLRALQKIAKNSNFALSKLKKH